MLNILQRLKRVPINILCFLIPDAQARRRFRIGSVFPIGFKKVKQYDEPYSKAINVAFSFNSGYIEVAKVSILSLLTNSLQSCSYNFYLLVDNSVSDEQRRSLMDIIAYLDKKSTVYFLSPNDDFDKSFLGGWDKSIYHRLMLPKLLPNIDRIIYCDADTIFMRRLSEADSLELGDNLIAGVKEDSKGYINSGFLVLNLKQMRKEETYKKFISVSQTEKLLYPDQDVLNLVCKNRILYLAWKFNVRVDHILHDYKFRSAKECMQAGRECVMIHFISSFKPWNGCKYPFNSYWWKYKKILDNLPL